MESARPEQSTLQYVEKKKINMCAKRCQFSIPDQEKKYIWKKKFHGTRYELLIRNEYLSKRDTSMGSLLKVQDQETCRL